MTFQIIDKKTGKEPTDRVITNIAKKQGLIAIRIDQFAIMEDGQIILLDDCGRAAYLDMNRFEVRWDNGWIPCSERLPDEKQTVLVWCPEYKNIYCAYLEKKKWWMFGALVQIVPNAVVAWMPLPEPYREDGE